jgi:hypothetical protein
MTENDAEWEDIRSFQAKKIEEKEGVESVIANIRLSLNKLTETNYQEVKQQILDLVENHENISQISEVIYEIATNNRFLSKIYAKLYSDLIQVHEQLKENVDNSFDSFAEMFKQFEFVEAKDNYDLFCKINKTNEKRKALSAFFVDLMSNNVLTKQQIVSLLVTLLNQVNTLIRQDNKKNEVDEIIENVGILFTKELADFENLNENEIGKFSIQDFVEFISCSKTKSFKSLTNKAIFKFMDIQEFFE